MSRLTESKVYGALMQALQRNGIDINDEDAIIAILDTCLIATQESEGVWRVPVQCPWTEEADAKAQVIIHAEEYNPTIDISIWPKEELEQDEPTTRMKAEWNDLVY